jgi:hypothetical protein
MRFAIKTRPEHQAWEELRDSWLAADEIPLFESVRWFLSALIPNGPWLGSPAFRFLLLSFLA